LTVNTLCHPQPGCLARNLPKRLNSTPRTLLTSLHSLLVISGSLSTTVQQTRQHKRETLRRRLNSLVKESC
jgi:hypothetical protein